MVVRRWAAPTALVAMMLVAACGTRSSGTTSSSSSPAGASATASAMASVGPPPTAATLATQLKAALTSATSVHIASALSQGGSHVSLNASLTRSGDFYGQVTYQNRPVTVLATRGQTYAKISPAALATLHLPSSICVLMCDKYLKMSAGQAKGFTGQLGWSDFVGGPAKSVSPHMGHISPATVNGQPAWAMRVSGIGTFYVAAHGTPYLLRVAKGADRIDFTQWNSATIPPPPPADQVIDPSQLKHL